MTLIFQVITFFVLLLSFRVSDGADFFESVNARLQCYDQVQPGCDSSFPDAYPDLAWSHLNLTRADTYAYLFTTRNPDKPELMHKCGGRLPPNSNFNPSDDTMIIIPGFVSGVCNYAIFREIKNEWMKRGGVNVILIDWMWGNIFDLIEAYHNMFIVADQLAHMVKYLKEELGVPRSRIACMGHSYGAHLCGYVSQRERIGIIHGVEPSGVVQAETDPPDTILDRDDADCVQGIHTNGGQCLPLFFGANFNVGKVDFWVNGGLFQSNCYIYVLQAFLKGDFIFGTFALLPAACSHFQALLYYKTSINPEEGCEYVGVKCESALKFKLGGCRKCDDDGENCAVMGAHACDCLTENQRSQNNANGDGRYYVNTKALCPFCGNRGIDINGKHCKVPKNNN